MAIKKEAAEHSAEHSAEQSADWLTQLKCAEKDQKSWVERSRKIVRRYRDDRRSSGVSNEKKYNILWSNVRTIFPSIYAKKPEPQVERRYKDANPVGRCASEILERVLKYEVDHYCDFDSAIRNALLDRLLCGRGVAWVRFEEMVQSASQLQITDDTKHIAPTGQMPVAPSGAPSGQPPTPAPPQAGPAAGPAGMFGAMPQPAGQPAGLPALANPKLGAGSPMGSPMPGQTPTEPSKYECTPVDYVFWEDFRYSPARTWEEVTWVARRVYMSKEEGTKRFGDIFKQVSLSHVPTGIEGLEGTNPESQIEKMKKAKVWEIWDKSSMEVIWVAESFPKILDKKPDFFELENFFPCPKPLFATLTTDTLIPVPDYAEYQDQAQEMDDLTQRISMLVKAVKVVGVYDVSQDGVQRMLNEGVDNTLIPVTNWSSLSERGGIKGSVDFLPLDVVVTALDRLYTARDACKQVIYEITGLSDIIRGASVASETATAQQIKSNFASLRLKETVADVARFASDLLRIKSELICSNYSSQALIQISGVLGTDDAELAEPAVQLLKIEPARNYQIDIVADSMVEMDEQAEKQNRAEFLQAAAGFIKQAVEGAQNVPELAPLLGELLMFGVRGFKVGRPVEAAFERTVKALSQPKPPQPDPAQIQAQQEQQQFEQKMQADMQIAQAKSQADMQAEQTRAQADIAIEKQRAEINMQMEQYRASMESQASAQLAMQEQAFERWKAELDAATKVIVAQISATKAQDEAVSGNAEGEFNQEVRP